MVREGHWTLREGYPNCLLASQLRVAATLVAPTRTRVLSSTNLGHPPLKNKNSLVGLLIANDGHLPPFVRFDRVIEILP